MKNKAWLLGIFVVGILLTGCGREPQMDQLENGAYHYNNETYNFKLDLPEEFIYYQVQTKIGKDEKNVVSTDWNDVEFYVPMNDRTYPQEVPAYAKAFTVRVFEAGKYREQKGFEKLIEGTDRTYAIKFWDKRPKDWQEKWQEDLAEQIKKSLQVIK